VFLDINGWLVADLEERLFDAMIAISTRTLDKRGLADLPRLLATEKSTESRSREACAGYSVRLRQDRSRIRAGQVLNLSLDPSEKVAVLASPPDAKT